MNKCIFRFLISLMILTCTTLGIAQGEKTEFSFRNDIHFGDDSLTVSTKEGFSEDHYSSVSKVVEIDNIALSGIRNNVLLYSFDPHGLNEITILYRGYFKFLQDIDGQRGDYSLIEEGLTRKYDKAESTDASAFTPYSMGHIASFSSDKYQFEEASLRVLPLDDNKVVVIEHVLVDKEGKLLHMLNYCLADANYTEQSIVDNDL